MGKFHVEEEICQIELGVTHVETSETHVETRKLREVNISSSFKQEKAAMRRLFTVPIKFLIFRDRRLLKRFGKHFFSFRITR